MSSSLSNHSSSQKNGACANKVASAPFTPLDNLLIVIELRIPHREAENKGKKAPRSSDKKKKWEEWEEYLDIIQLLKSDLSVKIDSYSKLLLEMKEEGGEGKKQQQTLSCA